MGVALVMFRVVVLRGWVQFRLCSEVWFRGMGVALAMFKAAV